MPAIINTNIASLNAQRNLTSSQSALQVSLQRLSSGLRINSAKDDAAGLAISDRMTSQIRGLNQAARNANDGISLAQTAEGALSAIGTSLQRMRELAIQSANSTNSATDRAALNSESQQLLAEVQRIAQNTQFNGLNLLDGSFSAQQFQVGANANQTIAVSITGATTTTLGAWGGASASVLSAAVLDGTAPVAWTSSSTISIDGTSIGASVADSTQAGWSAGSAAAKALAVNSKTATTGVTATASTSVTGAAPTVGASLANGGLKINGISVGPVASATTAVGQGANAAAAINLVSSQTGVTATYSTTSGALTLTASDGRDIKIEAGTATAAGVAQVLNATGLTAADTGSTAATAGTDTIAFTGGVATTETAVINGVTFTFTQAGATSYVINSATSVTINADLTGITAAASGTLLVNGINAAKATGAATATALAPITAAGTATVTLTDARAGLAATVGRTASDTIANAATTQNVTGSNGTVDANAYNTIGGTLTLSASQNFTLTGTGTGLADGGLSSFTSSLSQLSAVSVSSLSGANSAINVIDAALSQVNSLRASLGAYQNRFESTVASLTTSSENLSAARSRIQDADFAAETAQLTRNQILQQAGTAMLAQANQLPSTVLSLLK
jgi:flagellin